MTAPRTLNLRLPLPPSANDYWMLNKERGYLHRTHAANKFRDRVKAAKGMPHLPLVNDISVTVRVYRERRSGDLDNFLKVLFDSLQGTAYVNDSQIVEIHATRHDDRYDPRVEVELRELNAVGELFPAAAEEVEALPFG